MKNYNMTMQAKKSRKVHKAKNILDEKCEFSHILWGTIIHHSFFCALDTLKNEKVQIQMTQKMKGFISTP